MLKSIELQGFKSFGKKNDLSFDTPVTGIVGPNGSGKSNVVEAIRFVLGEQSMKSLRGKSSSDLIFKGSKTLSSPNRAKVIITFKNNDRRFQFSEETPLSVDFDEISISREVFKDGGSVYTINGSEVRLKDVNDLLSSVGIGSSGHHIISQGEADRLLSSSTKDRKEIIEEALGLKSYQYKLRESERRLEKSIENLKEVDIQRREIAPHLRFLKKQVEKTEQAEEAKRSLTELYETYLSRENALINQEKSRIQKTKELIYVDLKEVTEKLDTYTDSKSSQVGGAIYNDELARIEENLSKIRLELDSLLKEETRLSTFIEIEKSNLDRLLKEDREEVTIPSTKLRSFINDLKGILTESSTSTDINFIKSKIKDIQNRIENDLGRFMEGGNTIAKEQKAFEIKDKIATLSSQISDFASKKAGFLRDEQLLKQRKEEIYKTEKENQSKDLEREREITEIKLRKQDLESKNSLILREESENAYRISLFEEEIREGGALLGGAILKYKDILVDFEVDKDELAHMRKDVERLKIKIEQLGGLGGEDLRREYEETLAREAFLEKESEDIERAKAQIEEIISSTRDLIEERFKTGVIEINKAFQEYFETMFGGGKAYLEVVAEKKRRRKSDEDEDISVDDEEEVEKGIDIHVNLPQKKVKELMMLSGGERSLTSIALLFAMSSVNPPPFIVLDETDAALDEANSRRYGDMLEKLSGRSQLVVVTHNRETMSRAGVLYGVTLGSDGASRVLTIKFEEAVKVAK